MPRLVLVFGTATAVFFELCYCSYYYYFRFYVIIKITYYIFNFNYLKKKSPIFGITFLLWEQISDWRGLLSISTKLSTLHTHFCTFSLPCPPTACHVVSIANLRGDDRYTQLSHWRTLNSNHGPPFYPLSYPMRILASVGIPFVLILIIKWKNLYLFHLLISFIIFFLFYWTGKKEKNEKKMRRLR